MQMRRLGYLLTLVSGNGLLRDRGFAQDGKLKSKGNSQAGICICRWDKPFVTGANPYRSLPASTRS